MKTLVLGAGPLGCLYTHRLVQRGNDVTILARGQRYDWIQSNGLVLVDEMTGSRETSRVQVVDALGPEDQYDLVIVLIRKNKLPPVLDTLAANVHLKNILFMGNNALGFGCYLDVLPEAKVLFGFPGAGGGMHEHIVHFADREKPGGKRRAVTIGEVDGGMRERTGAIKSLFETSGIPVDLTTDIDGWLKYHVALISPLVNALYKHGCDNYALARDKKTLQAMVRAAKEGGRVLKALGYTKRQPFQFKLIYWLPELLSVKALQSLLGSKFAEIAFSLHARAAQDEMRELADEFRSLIERTSVQTPNIDLLKNCVNEYQAAQQTIPRDG
ncbi:MAG: ketopantoate reductase family protein [Planctomycetota bacterium]|jgi:2-dehydropantoate 2-reductase